MVNRMQTQQQSLGYTILDSQLNSEMKLGLNALPVEDRQEI